VRHNMIFDKSTKQKMWYIFLRKRLIVSSYLWVTIYSDFFFNSPCLRVSTTYTFALLWKLSNLIILHI